MRPAAGLVGRDQVWGDMGGGPPYRGSDACRHLLYAVKVVG